MYHIWTRQPGKRWIRGVLLYTATEAAGLVADRRKDPRHRDREWLALPETERPADG